MSRSKTSRPFGSRRRDHPGDSSAPQPPPGPAPHSSISTLLAAFGSALLCLATPPAVAQEKLLAAPAPSQGSSLVVPTFRPMAVIGDGDDVMIDWKEVERAANDPLSDATTRAYARLLIAARDRTWRSPP